MADSIAGAAHQPLPFAPLRRATAPTFFESPYSDYYTDTSRSPDSAATSALQKHLLRRLNVVGAQILRKEPDMKSLPAINSALDALDAPLTAPESHTREPAEIDDSGLFMEDDDIRSDDGVDFFFRCDRKGALRSPTSREAQEIVDRVSKASAGLRERLEEVKHFNDLTTSRLEAAATEILHLRTKNDSLRSDLSFDHSELLFLKLQLRGLETQAAPFIGQVAGNAELVDGLERWKLDWHDVDERLRARRDKYVEMGYRKDSMVTNDGKPSLGHSHSSSATAVELLSPLPSPKKLTIHRPGMALHAKTVPHALDAVPASTIDDDDDVSLLTSSSLLEAVSGIIKTLENGATSSELGLAAAESAVVDVAVSSDGGETINDEKMSDSGLCRRCRGCGGPSETGKIVDGENMKDDKKETDVERVPQKTPWQELWESLEDLAGTYDRF